MILSYINCNYYTLITFIITLIMMSSTLIILSLYMTTKKYQRYNKCLPISFFFGEYDGCRHTIDSVIKENKRKKRKRIYIIHKIFFFIYQFTQ